MWAFFPKKSSMQKSARCLDCRSQLRSRAIVGPRFPFKHGVAFIESPSRKCEGRRAMSLIGLRSLVCERNLSPLARKTFCRALVWGIVVRVCIGPVI